MRDDDDDHAIRLELLNSLLQRALAIPVEVRIRLVKNNEKGITIEGAR